MKLLVTKGLPVALLICLIVYLLICLLVWTPPFGNSANFAHWPGWGRLCMLLGIWVSGLAVLTFKQPADQYLASIGDEHITAQPPAIYKVFGKALQIRPLAAAFILLLVYSLVWFIELEAPFSAIGQNILCWSVLGRLVMLVGVGAAIKHWLLS